MYIQKKKKKKICNVRKLSKGRQIRYESVNLFLQMYRLIEIIKIN